MHMYIIFQRCVLVVWSEDRPICTVNRKTPRRLSCCLLDCTVLFYRSLYQCVCFIHSVNTLAQLSASLKSKQLYFAFIFTHTTHTNRALFSSMTSPASDHLTTSLSGYKTSKWCVTTQQVDSFDYNNCDCVCLCHICSASADSQLISLVVSMRQSRRTYCDV